MKKPIVAILTSLLLAACSGYPYAVRDGGDGVYYAESPPAYTYVDGYFGFPYYGPYDWSWYYPLWYAPLTGPHYSWYRPPYYWSQPFYGVGDRYAYLPLKRTVPVRAGGLPDQPPIVTLPAASLRDATIQPPKSRRHAKHAGYYDAAYKSKAASRVYMPVDRTSGMPSMTPSRPSPGISSAPARRPSLGRVSRSKD